MPNSPKSNNIRFFINDETTCDFIKAIASEHGYSLAFAAQQVIQIAAKHHTTSIVSKLKANNLPQPRPFHAKKPKDQRVFTFAGERYTVSEVRTMCALLHNWREESVRVNKLDIWKALNSSFVMKRHVENGMARFVADGLITLNHYDTGYNNRCYTMHKKGMLFVNKALDERFIDAF